MVESLLIAVIVLALVVLLCGVGGVALYYTGNLAIKSSGRNRVYIVSDTADVDDVDHATMESNELQDGAQREVTLEFKHNPLE